MKRPGPILKPRQRRAERGFAIAPILYLLGLIGVGAGVLFSSYSQIIRSNQTMTNTLAAKNDLQGSATTLAATSWLSNDKTVLCPPIVGSNSPSTPSANCSTNASAITAGTSFANATAGNLPANYASISSAGSPVEVGVFKAGSGAKVLDPWGHYYLYCRWENGIGASPAIAIISAGANGKIETTCGSTTPGGDDLMVVWSTAVTQNRAAVWQTTTAGSSVTGAQFGAIGSQVSIGANGNVVIPGTLGVTGTTTLGTTSIGGALTATDIADTPISGSTGSFTTLAAGGAGQMTVDVSGNINTGGTLGVSGLSTLGQVSAGSSTLSYATVTNNAAIGGTLGVTGATTLGSTSVSDFATTDTSNSAFFAGGLNTSTGKVQIGTTVVATGSSAPLLTVGKGAGTPAVYPFMIDQYGNVTGGTFSGAFNGNLTGSQSGGSVSATSLSASGAATMQSTLGVTGQLNGTSAVFSGNVQAASFNGAFNGSFGGSMTGVLPIANGGTGQTTAASALSGLFTGAGTIADLVPAADVACCIQTSQLSNTGGAGTWSTVYVGPDGRVTGGTLSANSANSISDGSGDSVAVGTSSGITYTIGGSIQGNWTTTGLTIGSSKAALDKLDVYGATAIGTGYAGITQAPTNGLIIQGNVGIGTSNPGTNALQVSGTISATNFVGNGSGITGIGTSAISGIVGTANGGTGTGTTFTPGSVVYAGTSGIYAQDNANFFWDAINHRLGIGTSSPSYKLTIGGTAGTDGIKFPDATAQTTGVPTCPLGDNPVSCGTYWVCSSQRPASCFVTITLSPTTLTAAVYGASYDQIVTASGGAQPYSFSITAGSLPSGLSLSAAGLIAGTPVAAGTSSFTITATDTYNNTGSQAYTLTIAVPTITLSPTSLASGTYGSAYSQAISASGGISPYSYTITAGSLPGGLSLNSSSGILSGTPTAAGTASFTVTATDAHSYTGSQAYSLIIAASTITLSPTTLANGAYNTAYSQAVSASGGISPYSYSITSGSLPNGLSLSSSTGTLSGTPIAAGMSSFTITATDAHSYTGSQAYSLTITAPTITLSPTTLANGAYDTAYSQTVSASGGIAAYTYSSTSGSLPNGLSIASSTGVISGTPISAGTSNFTITATDAHSYTGSQAYSLTITPPAITLSPTSLPAGTQRVAYSQSLTASGGISPYSYSITSGSLPSGIALSSSGTISGSTASTGTFPITVTATDAYSQTGSQAYSLVINAVTIMISPSTLPNGTYASSYSQALTASGGASPYTYAVTSGSLPSGLSLSSGTISGTPTAVGTSSFTVTATDSNSNTGSQAYTLTIAAPTITLSPTSLASGTYAVSYSQTVSASGGISPYTYSITSGSLPNGLSLNSSSGAISGTPISAGTFSFTVTVTDSHSYTGSQAYSLTIAAPAITLSPTTLANGAYDTAYSQTVSAWGGIAAYTYSITSGSLPNGLSINSSTGVISGMPTTSGTFPFTVTATDAHSYTGSQAYSVTIAAPTITMSPASLASGTQNTAHSQTVSASGGISPYTYNITSGSLPSGISLNSSTGAISGTPSVSGTFSFTVTATDAHSYTGSQAYSITLASACTGTYTWTQRTSAGSRGWISITSSSDGTQLAVTDQTPGYIWTSTNSGATWTQQTGSGSRNWQHISSSSDGTHLVAVDSSPGYIYTSTNSGATWTQQTGAGSRTWGGIASDSTGTYLVAGDASPGYIYTSTNSGVTWTQRTGPGSGDWYGIASSSDGTHLVAASYGGGIWTSTNSGVTWTQQTGAGSRTWGGIASDSTGTYLVAGDASPGYIYTSTNSGATWTQQTGSGSRYWGVIASSSDGTHLIAGAVYSDYIYTSTNSGVTWTQQTTPGAKNWFAVASSSDGTRLAAADESPGYIWTATCP